MTAAAEATVLRAVVVETTDMTAYMDALAKVRAALERPGSPTAVRMLRARFVGPNAGAMAEHALDGEMGLAGIGGAQYGGDIPER